MNLDEPTYRTQLLLLDFLSSWDSDAATMSEQAFDLLVQDVMEAGAVTASMDENEQPPTARSISVRC